MWEDLLSELIHDFYHRDAVIAGDMPPYNGGMGAPTDDDEGAESVFYLCAGNAIPKPFHAILGYLVYHIIFQVLEEEEELMVLIAVKPRFQNPVIFTLVEGVQAGEPVGVKEDMAILGAGFSFQGDSPINGNEVGLFIHLAGLPEDESVVGLLKELLASVE
jgi:hypothetical protein